VTELSSRERHALGYQLLPRSLDEALRIMETSELAAETLGEHVFEYFLRNKRNEFERYSAQVSQWELDQLVGTL
ncbi:MAG: glutamine synthetase, partial [Arachnia sp.]